MKTCKYCGKEFTYNRRSQEYCSDECRKRVKYEKDRAWLEARPGKSAEYGRNWYANNTESRKQAARKCYQKRCLKKIEKERNNL